MHAAEVVWYVTGRFYAQGGTLFDVGYFLHIGGIPGSLFNGPPSESTAHFTFSADPFTAQNVTNGAVVPFIGSAVVMGDELRVP